MKLFLNISSAAFVLILSLLLITKIYHQHLYGPTIEMTDVDMIWALQSAHKSLVWLLLLLVLYTFSLLLALFTTLFYLTGRVRNIFILLFALLFFCLFILPFTDIPYQKQRTIFLLSSPAPLLGMVGVFIHTFKKKYPNLYYDIVCLSGLFVLNLSIIYFTDLYSWASD